MAGVVHSRKKGGKHGKARKAATKKANGYYSRQAIRTIANRQRKRAKHQKMVEKKAKKNTLRNVRRAFVFLPLTGGTGSYEPLLLSQFRSWE